MQQSLNPLTQAEILDFQMAFYPKEMLSTVSKSKTCATYQKQLSYHGNGQLTPILIMANISRKQAIDSKVVSPDHAKIAHSKSGPQNDQGNFCAKLTYELNH